MEAWVRTMPGREPRGGDWGGWPLSNPFGAQRAVGTARASTRARPPDDQRQKANSAAGQVMDGGRFTHQMKRSRRSCRGGLAGDLVVVPAATKPVGLPLMNRCSRAAVLPLVERAHWNVTSTAFVQLEVSVGFRSRYQSCHPNVCPAIAAIEPRLGCGICVRSMACIPTPSAETSIGEFT